MIRDIVRFADLAEASGRLAATASRRAKVEIVADLLLRVPPQEAPVVVPVLAGRLRQRRTGIGYAATARRPPAADESGLDVMAVDAAFEAAAGAHGAGSAGRRAVIWQDLLRAATGVEQELLVGLVTADVRQGAGVGVLTDGLAAATGVSAAGVRRAVTMAGDLVDVAVAVLMRGEAALADFAVRPGRALVPMLAGSAPGIDAALERTGPAHVDWKLDGVRAQAHVTATEGGRRVRIFTRSLEEITDRAPGVVASLARLDRPCILDGELLVLGPGAVPRPFQQTASRVAQQSPTGEDTLTYVAFDAVSLDGVDLLDEPLEQRRRALDALVPSDLRTAAQHLTLAGVVVTAPLLRCPEGTLDAPAAGAFAAEALARGHEGVVIKAMGSAYTSGRRGSAWIKVKPRETLDLVVLAAEWGSGRRSSWLSNLHLGARDPDGAHGPVGGFVMLGKTFKGLTDSMLIWQTQRLTELAVNHGSGEVEVRPQLVVEVAFDGVQTSPRYPSGMALRFARVLRHRPDKAAAEADTVAAVRAIHQRHPVTTAAV